MFLIVRVSKYTSPKNSRRCQENFSRLSTATDLISVNSDNLQFAMSRENFRDTKSTSRFRKRSSFELFTQRRRVDFPATSVNAAHRCRLSLYGSFHRREILPRYTDILAVTRVLNSLRQALFIDARVVES